MANDDGRLLEEDAALHFKDVAPALPQNVRPALLAAFACAMDLGLTVEDVEGALRTTRNEAASV